MFFHGKFNANLGNKDIQDINLVKQFDGTARQIQACSYTCPCASKVQNGIKCSIAFGMCFHNFLKKNCQPHCTIWPSLSTAHTDPLPDTIPSHH